MNTVTRVDATEKKTEVVTYKIPSSAKLLWDEPGPQNSNMACGFAYCTPELYAPFLAAFSHHIF